MTEVRTASPRTNVRRRASAANRSSEYREMLLAAGAQLFAARGIAHVSVAEIIAAAGLSRATFYGFFANKSELAAALLKPVFCSGFDALNNLRALPARKAAQGIIDTYWQLWSEHRNALLMTGVIEQGVFPYLESEHQRFNDALYEVLTIVESGGLLRNDSAKLTLELLARTSIPILSVYNDNPQAEALYRDSMLALIIKS